MNLSVIIPNYNNAEYLEECLESVLSQTRPPDDIIIADDASSDNSRGIIQAYEQKYESIRGLYREENLGVAENRHKAILEANGEYITTLDSDDFYFSRNKIEEELKLIQEKKDQGAESVIAYSDIIRVDNNGNKLSNVMKKRKVAKGNILFPILTRSKPVPRDLVFRRDQYFDVGGFDPQYPIYEDWDLKIRLSAKSDFFYTGVEGVAYRKRDDGLSSANTFSQIYWQFQVFHKNLHLLAARLRMVALAEFYWYIVKSLLIKILKGNSRLFKAVKWVKNYFSGQRKNSIL